MIRPLTATMPPPGPPWTADYLSFVLPARAEDVLRVEGPYPSATPESRAEWVWIATAQRLAWQYGADGALARLQGYGRE